MKYTMKEQLAALREVMKAVPDSILKDKLNDLFSTGVAAKILLEDMPTTMIVMNKLQQTNKELLEALEVAKYYVSSVSDTSDWEIIQKAIANASS